MSFVMTQGLLNDLAGYKANGDTAGYYSALADAGSDYGANALGVVNNDTFDGMVANDFLVLQAESDGITLTPQQISDFSQQLMDEDYNSRANNFDNGNTGELSGDEIQTNHYT